MEILNVINRKTCCGIVRSGATILHPGDATDIEITLLVGDRFGGVLHETEVVTDCRVGVDVSMESLLADFHAVIVACGMGSVPKLGIPGEDLRGVWDALDFIERVKQGNDVGDLGERIAVIGAGISNNHHGSILNAAWRRGRSTDVTRDGDVEHPSPWPRRRRTPP